MKKLLSMTMLLLCIGSAGLLTTGGANAQILNEKHPVRTFRGLTGFVTGHIFLIEQGTTSTVSDEVKFFSVAGVDKSVMASDRDSDNAPADAGPAFDPILPGDVTLTETTTNKGKLTYTPTPTQPGFATGGITYTIQSDCSSPCSVPESSSLSLFGISLLVLGIAVSVHQWLGRLKSAEA